jgi:transcriptional regulator with XRE-family HTH domain
MLGTDLPGWRKRQGFTQEALIIALGIKSRQTIITWEKSTEPLPKMVLLALLAIEHIPEARFSYGQRFEDAQAVRKFVWAEREYPGKTNSSPAEQS